MLVQGGNEQHLKPGDRLVLAPGHDVRAERSGDLAIFEVTTAPTWNRKLARNVDNHDDQIEIDTSSTQIWSSKDRHIYDNRRIVWSRGLPQGSPDQIKAFVAAAIEFNQRSHGRLIVSLVRSAEPGRVVTEVVEGRVWAGWNSDADPEDGASLGIAAENEADAPLFNGTLDFFWPKGRPLPVVGDGILTANLDCHIVDGVTQSQAQRVCNLGQFADVEALATFAREGDSHGSGRGGAYLESRSGIEHEYARAVARTEPDIGLVLFVEESRDPVILGKLGGMLFNTDDLGADIYGESLGAGLYVLINPQFWSHQSYEGEWDGGLDCDWRAATEEDLPLFGTSVEQIAKEFVDYTDEVATEDDIRAAMVKAAEYLAAERANDQAIHDAAASSAPAMA